MLKVMIVDDEYLAREGMKRTIPWEKYSCSVCGEAPDGLEGVELAKQLKPDLIITDISMPEMDGISMAKEIRKFLPKCKFIIITGFDEFQYAKEAIKINAVDFILKPIDENEFLTAVERVVKDYESSNETLSITSEKLLLDMMRGKIDRENIRKEIERNNINIEKIIIICIQNDSYEFILETGKMEILYKQNRTIRNALKALLDMNIFIIESHENKLAAIISVDGQFYPKDLDEKLKEIQRYVFEKDKVTITMGVSDIALVENIKDAYIQGKESLKNRLYAGKGSITYFSDIRSVSDVKWTFILMEEKQLLLFIRARDRVKVEKQLKHIYFDILKKSKSSDDLIKQVSIEIIIKALNLLSEFNISAENVVGKEFNVYKKAARLSTINELYSWTSKTLIDIVDRIKEMNIEASETGIEKAIEYINKHFCEDISLSDVAKEVYMSESYLSRRMKKIVGISFVEYITKLRMEKAMEYLKEPKVKISDIAPKLGYPDYRYFSQIFKKHTGYSPSEFIKNKD